MQSQIPADLQSTVSRFGARPHADGIRTASGRFLLWPIDPAPPEAADVLNLAGNAVRVACLHSQAVHAAHNDVDLSQSGRAKKHRAATAASVDSFVPLPAALVRLEREHAANVAAFYNAEPAPPVNVVQAIEAGECRLYIAGADAPVLGAALAAVESGTPTPRQRRLVYAWRSSPYDLRPEFSDALDLAWRALRRSEVASEAAALDRRGDGLAWLRLVVGTCCKAFREDSGLNDAELRDLIDTPTYRDSLPLWFTESEARAVAAIEPGPIAEAA